MTKACVGCGVDVDKDIWHEELGMCVECSHEYFDDDDDMEGY